MVVDDDDDLRDMISMLVRAQGFCTIGAVDGLDALDKLEQGTLPSLILLDLRMPRMNGIEFLVAVHDTPAAGIPVVALTGDLGACQEARRAGAIDCLLKPIDAQTLLGTIRGHAGAQPGHDARPER
jgi:chemosensory pili system protein ChpA (sensor histidine kinase/response regulator)